MKDIAIYGAGGLGREIASWLDSLIWDNPEGWNLIGFFDDSKHIGEQISHFGKNLGGINELNAWAEPLCVVLAFGSPESIKTVRFKITNPLISFPNLICKDFVVADSVSFSIGDGNVIMADCLATTGVQIGNHNLLNGFVKLGHDVKIGNFNVFMPGCMISGNVSIGCENLFGSMAFVRQLIHIGNNVHVGPLSALLTKPKNDSTYIGNPAKIFRF